MEQHNKLASLLLPVSVLIIPVGACGMAVSFLFLSSGAGEDVVAGAAGFVAGATMIGTGLIAAALFIQASANTKAQDE